MNISDTQTLITTALSDLGSAVLVILGAFITLAVAYLVFKFGWSKVGHSVGDTSGFSHELAGERGISRFKKHVRSRMKRGLSISN